MTDTPKYRTGRKPRKSSATHNLAQCTLPGDVETATLEAAHTIWESAQEQVASQLQKMHRHLLKKEAAFEAERHELQDEISRISVNLTEAQKARDLQQESRISERRKYKSTLDALERDLSQCLDESIKKEVSLLAERDRLKSDLLAITEVTGRQKRFFANELAKKEEEFTIKHDELNAEVKRSEKELQIARAALKEESRRSHEEQERLNRKNTDLQVHCDEFQELAAIRERELNKSIDELQAENIALNSNLASQERELSRASTMVGLMQDQISQFTETRSLLKKQLNEREVDIETLRANLTENATKISQSVVKEKALEARAVELAKRLSFEEGRAERAEAVVNLIKNKLLHAEQHLDDLDKSMNQELTIERERASALAQHQVDLESKVNEQQVRINELEKMLITAKKNLASMENYVRTGKGTVRIKII